MSVNLYVFSSANLTNIWAGIGARRWAVSRTQAANQSIQTKASRLPIGVLGVFYCVETQALTTPFLVRSKPEKGAVIANIWPETWELPFEIVPLGSPNRHVHKDELRNVIPSLQQASRCWDSLFHVSPSTVFAPSPITESDWAVLVSELAAV